MKTVIVTGAAGGMGQVIVQQLLVENYEVVGLDLATEQPFEQPLRPISRRHVPSKT